MKDRTISIAVGKGNYESLRVDVFLSGKIEDGDDIKVEYNKLFKLVNTQLRQEIEKAIMVHDS